MVGFFLTFPVRNKGRPKAMQNVNQSCNIGFVGLGVMGKNLALNLADHGYRVAGFDLDTDKVKDVLDTEAKERPRSLYLEGIYTVTSQSLLLRLPIDSNDITCNQGRIIFCGIRHFR